MTDDNPPEGSEQTFRLMYRSRSLIPEEGRKAELGRLFSAARSLNKGRGITGALLLTRSWFVQVLEGDEASVRSLFEHIEHDTRHDRVELLDAGVVGTRVFARWSMARVSADGEPDIPLIAHTDGISAASSRGTTADQEQVLDVMREAAREAQVAS